MLHLFSWFDHYFTNDTSYGVMSVWEMILVYGWVCGCACACVCGGGGGVGARERGGRGGKGIILLKGFV